MLPARLTPTSALAAACAAASAWCAAGALALTDAGPRAARIGVLPPVWWLAAFITLAVGAAWALRLSADRARPLFFSAILLLPWLPVPLPDAVLLFAGPVAWIVWAAIAGAMMTAGNQEGPADPAAPARRSRGLAAWATNPARAPWIAFVCAALIYGATAARVAPMVPGGDEPHYLIIAQSLWRDHDLRIENNHQRGDYLEYFKGALRPDYLRRGQDGQIYSIHMPGVPAIIAPVLALGGYRLVNAVLALASAAATAVAWRMTFAIVGSAAAAWFGWAAVAITVPFLLLSFTVYPDGPGAVVVLCSFAALVSLSARPARPAWWWAAAGLLPALLPWFHPRFAVIAGAIGAIFVLRAISQGSASGNFGNASARGGASASRGGIAARVSAAVAFAAVPVVSAAGWFAYYAIIYGKPDPSIAYGHYTQMSLERMPVGVLGFLADQQYGLLVTAPVYAIALAGLVPLVRRHPRLALEWLVIVVPYTLVSAMYFMWWGGFASPARFIGVTFLLFSLPAAMAWESTRAMATRALLAAALAVSLAIAAIMAGTGSGQFAFNVRDQVSPWLVWMSQVRDVGRAVPGLFRTSPMVAAAEAAIWGVLLFGAWLAARGVSTLVASAGSRTSNRPAEPGPHDGLSGRDRVRPGAAALIALVVFAAASAGAASLVWRVEGTNPAAATTGQLRLADAVADGRAAIGLTFEPPGIVSAGQAAERLRMGGERVSGAPQDPWLWIPHVPAGRYRLWIDNRNAGAAFDADVFVGRTDAPVDRWHSDALALGASSRDLWLPVDVHSISVRGSDAARRAIRSVWLQPVDAHGETVRLIGGRASGAVRFGSTLVFGVGESSFLEPGGVWTAGGQEAVLVMSAPGGRAIPMTIAAGDAATAVEVRADAWSDSFELASGERREMTVPARADGTAVLRLRTSAGFRPASRDPKSTDMRLLGVRIEFR